MDKLAKKLIKDYPLLEENTPSSWIMIRASGKSPSINSLEVCHANIRHEDKGIFKEALLACPKKDDCSLSYINYLIDYQFKKFNHLISLKTLDDEYYIHVTGLDEFPANAFMNFCIATRGPIEFPTTIKHWNNLRNLGVDSNLAIVLAGLSNPHGKAFKSLDDRLDCIGPPSAGHWWFDMGTAWQSLLKAEMPHMSEPYMSNPLQCNPTNTVWGVQSRQQTMDYFNFTLRELMEKFSEENA